MKVKAGVVAALKEWPWFLLGGFAVAAVLAVYLLLQMPAALVELEAVKSENERLKRINMTKQELSDVWEPTEKRPTTRTLATSGVLDQQDEILKGHTSMMEKVSTSAGQKPDPDHGREDGK